MGGGGGEARGALLGCRSKGSSTTQAESSGRRQQQWEHKKDEEGDRGGREDRALGTSEAGRRLLVHILSTGLIRFTDYTGTLPSRIAPSWAESRQWDQAKAFNHGISKVPRRFPLPRRWTR